MLGCGIDDLFVVAVLMVRRTTCMRFGEPPSGESGRSPSCAYRGGHSRSFVVCRSKANNHPQAWLQHGSETVPSTVWGYARRDCSSYDLTIATQSMRSLLTVASA